jgi:hypothetical protein
VYTVVAMRMQQLDGWSVVWVVYGRLSSWPLDGDRAPKRDAAAGIPVLAKVMPADRDGLLAV